MAKEVVLPEISENIDSGDVVKVLVKEGDTVEVDQALIEVETEKASFEVPSTVAGKVAEIKVKEGDKIDVGGVIVTIEESGDSKSGEKPDDEDSEKDESDEDAKEKKSGEKPKVKEKAKKEESEDEESEEDKDNDESEEEKNIEEEEKDEADEDEIEEESKKEIKSTEKKSGKKESDKKSEKSSKKESSKDEPEEESEKDSDEDDSEKDSDDTSKDKSKESKDDSKEKSAPSKTIGASPSVRRLARELGVDLSNIEGSGASGRITEEDVKSHIKTSMSGGGSGKVSTGSIKLPDFSKWGNIEIEKMSNVRKKTAETMLQSWNSVPQVTQFDKADITSLEEFRKKNAEEIKKQGGSLTMTAILVKVITLALQKFPNFNTSINLADQTIINKKYYNIGIAVDTDRGLLVPVIKNTDSKGLTEISIELTQLAEKARNKKITLEEMEGGTFTISNLGGIGGTGFSPIVYSPQVAILGVSRASKEPVYMDDKFEPRLMLPLSLSYDHRIIDGADAARFLRWVCGSLENLFNLFL